MAAGSFGRPSVALILACSQFFGYLLCVSSEGALRGAERRAEAVQEKPAGSLPFCCFAARDAKDTCNSCYSNAFAEQDSNMLGDRDVRYCTQNKNGCDSCQGTWCNDDRADASSFQTVSAEPTLPPTVVHVLRNPSPPPALTCQSSQVLNSNRTGTAECSGKLGDECFYKCDAGYIAVGRHVCQSLEIGGELYLNRSFYGGTCYRLCSATSCPAGNVPVRMNSSDGDGACMSTTCKTPDAALRHLARGNYELWRLARSDVSGIYVDHLTFGVPQEGVPKGQNNLQGATDVTGLGLIMESIADAMGWIRRDEYLARVNKTISALANRLGDDWHLTRGPSGYLPRYFSVLNGALFDSQGGEGTNLWSTMATGIAYSGILFVKTYLKNAGDTSTEAKHIVDLVDEMVSKVKWNQLLCMQKFGDASVSVLSANNKSGTGIPYLLEDDGTCKDVLWPAGDGMYDFNEMMPALWLSYKFVCGSQPKGKCGNVPLQNAWEAWEARPSHPDLEYEKHTLLSLWSSYIVQIPYYTVHAFNSNPQYEKLLRNAWLADWGNYKSSAYYAGDHRYGLGAGPDIEWCSGTTYQADRLETNPNMTGCRTWSPYATAGYLAVAPDTIKPQLLQLLAEGETVLPFWSDYHVLGRKSMIDPSWNESSWITMVDISSELLGLSTLWLGKEFFTKNTNHFAD